MPTLKKSPRPSNESGSGSRTAALALGTLVAIAVTVLVLALTGARGTAVANPPGATNSGSAHRTWSHHPRSRGCRAVLDTVTGEMHGGCPPDHARLNPVTP
jgi:hypothetical protein